MLNIATLLTGRQPRGYRLVEHRKQIVGSLKMPRIISPLCRCAGMLLMLALVSCVRPGPSDLTLRKVFLADWSSQLKQWRNISRTAYAQQGIVLELTSVEPFAPQRPFILEDFCGEELNPGELGSAGLYVPADRNLPDRLDQPVSHARPDSPYVFYILIPARSDRQRYDPQLVDFNLEHDNRDICLRTKFMREDYVWRQSNEVRVPRRLIDQAFRAGLKPLPAMKPL